MMMANSKVRRLVAVSLGAIAGALGRYYISNGISETVPTDFPIGTLTVNLIGCFLIGIVAPLAATFNAMHPEVALMLLTGCLGSLTTFSSYELETVRLMQTGLSTDDILYWIGSPVLGLTLYKIADFLTQKALALSTVKK